MDGKVLELKGIAKNKTGKILNPTEAMYQRALTEKILLVGELDEAGIDWTHFDFMIGAMNIPQGKTLTYLQTLQLFWKELWPYFARTVKEYEIVHENWVHVVKEQDEMLVKYAEVEHEKKLLEQFVKATDNYHHYEKWKKSFGKRSEEESDPRTKKDT